MVVFVAGLGQVVDHCDNGDVFFEDEQFQVFVELQRGVLIVGGFVFIVRVNVFLRLVLFKAQFFVGAPLDSEVESFHRNLSGRNDVFEVLNVNLEFVQEGVLFDFEVLFQQVEHLQDLGEGVFDDGEFVPEVVVLQLLLSVVLFPETKLLVVDQNQELVDSVLADVLPVLRKVSENGRVFGV